jgi:hypothetical protein
MEPEKITSDAKSAISGNSSDSGESNSGLFKLGVVAIASALLGGIAAAWWYRKTVQKLHETGENSNNPHFGMDSEDFVDGTPNDF